MRASTNPREALALARDGRVRFLQALRLRPTSPFLWANLALTKLYLNEFDDEMRSALRHADELGPWEPTVQQTILFVGLAAWQDLDSGLRQARDEIMRPGGPRPRFRRASAARKMPAPHAAARQRRGAPEDRSRSGQDLFEPGHAVYRRPFLHQGGARSLLVLQRLMLSPSASSLGEL